MPPLSLGLSPEGTDVILTGETKAVWQSRRISLYLRDYLKANLHEDGRIIIPIEGQQVGPLVRKIEESLRKGGFEQGITSELSLSIADFQRAEEQFKEFSLRAKEIWANNVPLQEFQHFSDVLAQCIPGRRLYDLQLLAAYHLAFAQNAANFSAPGAGKTSIVYGAFAFLNSLPSDHPKYVNKLFVIGPLSSFGPWESEFRECFLRDPRSNRLSGGVPPDARKRILYSELAKYRDAELTLASYQSVPYDLEDIQHFLTRPWNKVMVVLDEAHKIKNSTGGIWAESVLQLARMCSSRVVLTGTPAPNGYEDLFNLFRFIWPDRNVVQFHIQHLKDMSHNPFDPRIETLTDNISPFFIRIRKSDLHLPEPVEKPPLMIPMGPKQEHIYRFIEEKYISYLESKSNDSWAKDTLTKARLIRLMQAATNPGLLRAPLDSAMLGEGGEGSSALFIDDSAIISEIRGYANSETPTKFTSALSLVDSILRNDSGSKVIVWCVFVANLFALHDLFEAHGIASKILYGGTPTETDEMEDDIETREKIVEQFHRPDSSFRVIIANPFAVGESISLHKACRNAIYLERNFNAAAFLQSKDRIHRYGLPEDAIVTYYYLQSQGTVDNVIHDRLLEKEASMMRVMESRDIPLISLNMDSDEVQEDAEDVRAIIRDYVKRTVTNSTSGR
ncbi:MAG: DEAD/DEAH box helicase [Terracidiphilus sp.]|jgi:SNF2 family DNA or RNA helicase